MPLDVTLQLSDAEVAHFRSVMRRVCARDSGRGDADIAASAGRVVQALRSTTHSPYILRRLECVDRLVEMLGDPQWQLPELERRRVLDVLAYVAEVHDLVPDDVPMLGLLDDAIMLELVLHDLRHELEAYEEFDAFRSAEIRRATGRTVSLDDWLAARRQALHVRMRERRQRDLAGLGGDLEPIVRF